MKIRIRRLEAQDDRTGFRSGNVELDRFFARYASQNQFRHHIGTTYVALDEAGKIVGFATVTASELTTARLSETKRKRLPAYPVPVLRLARLAVDERVQGQGVAKALLRAVFALAHQMASDMGCLGVVVDAKQEAVDYYRKLGFIELQVNTGQLGDRPEPLPMFLELSAIPNPNGE
ncbi:MAG: GNAT family N-acetyltransferase [Alphaproteobacteria bacterium]|nr:GNAT family N-acetyltransferase [Alphaproteobacteria bacterium]MDE2113036.1 GNAT family N-acetyltransferase [Alphaproteobacteria bacterium]MDE2493683.1 GNAT family N-acetyltransferase [Alphaproteobacteria bacterium]